MVDNSPEKKNKNLNKQERRHGPRFIIKNIYLQISSVEKQELSKGKVIDLNEGGISAEINNPLTVSQHVNITVHSY